MSSLFDPRLLSRATLLTAVLAICGVAFPVHAQTAGAEAAAEQKGGLKLGNSQWRFIPALSLQLAYDTNVTNRPDGGTFKGTGADAVKELEAAGDLIIRVNAGIRFVYPTKTIGFLIGGTIGYNAYLGLSELETTQIVNGVAVTKKQSTNKLSDLNASATLGFSYFTASRVFGIVLRDNFFYQNQPENNPLFFQLANRMTNNASLDFRIAPASLANMKFTIRGKFGFEKYTDDNLANLGNISAGGQFHYEWLFLNVANTRRTAFFAVAGVDWLKYGGFDDFTPAGLQLRAPDALPIRVDVGVIGQVTPTIAINTSINFQAIMMSESELDSYMLPGLRAELTWQAASRTQLQIGFTREATPASIYGWFASNKIYLNFRQWLVNDKLRLGVAIAYDLQQFGDVKKMNALYDTTYPTFNTAAFKGYFVKPDRLDHVITAAPFIRYNILDWLHATLAYQLTMRMSDGELRSPRAATNFTDQVFESKFDLMKHEIMLTFNLQY